MQAVRQEISQPVTTYRELQERFGPLGIVFDVFETVQFCTDSGRWLVTDCTAEVPVPGLAVFVKDYDPFWGDGEPYQSAVVKNATFADIAALAAAAMRTTDDTHHRFFKGVRVFAEEHGISRAELLFDACGRK